MSDNKKLFIEKMQQENFNPLVIDTFMSYYEDLSSGKSAYIHEKDLNPVEHGALTSYGDLKPYTEKGKKVLKNSVMIKLNGGLGTSMGLEGPKCMLPVKKDLSFFDITANQIKVMNKEFGIQVPLLLMNSFRTEDDTLKLLEKYPELSTGIKPTFIQNKYPKVMQDALSPVSWPEEPIHEWNPPGHGDIYTALYTTGRLDSLLEKGIKYAFVSNIDNLGASMDLTLLGYFAEKDLPFLMEVVERTEMDKKGGHLARLKENGRLVLREAAQCDENETEEFQDINRYGYFNSNNIWINLEYLKKLFDSKNEEFKLPLIVNKKKLDPTDDTTPPVYQLETAMGSAISLFDGSEAIVITDERFRPVKKWDNLVILWSDYFQLTTDYKIIVNPKRNLGPINVTLDKKFYGKLDQINERFPQGVPSLINCKSFEITGDICFGENISIKGDVHLNNVSEGQTVIMDDEIIDNENVIIE